MSTNPVYVGVDMAKESFAVTVCERPERWTASNNGTGIADTVARLEPLHPTLIVIETTGGLERPLVTALAAAGLPVAVVNPARTRAYALSMGRLAKTDPIDADVIAHFAQAIKPDPQPQPSAADQELKDLLARRSQLIGMLSAEKNRLSGASEPIRTRIAPHITWLEQEIHQLDEELDAKLSANTTSKQRAAQLQTVPGVGKAVARTLIIGLPELGQLDRKKIAALVGVAPWNRDSGKFSGKRFVCGGRSAVRTMLYMAALVGTRWNPVIKAFYERLIKAGKCKSAALTACLHKLLLILNAMVRDGTFWQPKTA
jgi:transposase